MEYDPTNDAFSEEDLRRFAVFNSLHFAKKDAGLAMKRIVELNAQLTETTEQEEMRLAKLAHAKRQLVYAQQHTEKQLGLWRTLNP